MCIPTYIFTNLCTYIYLHVYVHIVCMCHVPVPRFLEAAASDTWGSAQQAPLSAHGRVPKNSQDNTTFVTMHFKHQQGQGA